METPRPLKILSGIKDSAATLAFLAFAVLCVVLIMAPEKIGKAAAPLFEKTNMVLDNLNGTVTRTNSTIDKFNDQLDGQSDNIRANGEAITVAINQATQLVMDLRIQLLGGPANCKPTGKLTPGGSREIQCQEIPGLFPLANDLVFDMRKDLNRLTDSADGALKPLAATLTHLDSLLVDLDQEVKSGGVKTETLLESAKKDLDDLDRLLADPHIQAVLANVDQATLHTAEAMKSVDIALEPWRKRAGLLKSIFSKVFTVFKFTWSL